MTASIFFRRRRNAYPVRDVSRCLARASAASRLRLLRRSRRHLRRARARLRGSAGDRFLPLRDPPTDPRLQDLSERLVSAVNLAVPGSSVSDSVGLLGQVDQVPAETQYVLVEAGSADLCRGETITPLVTFRATVQA